MGRRGEKVTTIILHDFLSATFSRDEAIRAKAKFELGKAQKSQNTKGNRYYYIGLIVIGVLFFLLALGIDYTILTDFWNVQFANEFGEVPDAFKGGIIAKSLQVLFAVGALHAWLHAIGRLGRGIYMGILGVLALLLILGIGGLYSMGQMPEGTVFLGVELNQYQGMDAESELCSLGIGDCEGGGSTEEVEPTGPDYSWIIPVLWFAAMSLIFVVVSSVGAFALHAAWGGVNGLLERYNSADWSGGSERKLSDAGDRVLELKEILRILDDPVARSNRYGNLLAQFASDYRVQDKANTQGLSETMTEMRKHWNPGFVKGMMTGSVV